MTQLLSFHNDKKIKQFYVSRLKAHAKADEIIKGQYWQDGKGCAVGCTIHSGQHNSYETELGLPEWLAKLEDKIFEGVSNKDAKKFAVDFLSAIPVGVNLDRIKWQFCSYVLKNNLKLVKNLRISEQLKLQVSEAIRGAKAVNDQAVKLDFIDVLAAKSAAYSAYSAAYSASSTAYSAAYSAADSAASAAYSAADSAASAADSASSAAKSAAYSAADSASSTAYSAAYSAAAWAAYSASSAAEYKKFSQHLLKLLRKAK